MSVPISQARWILLAICVLMLAINIDYTSVNLALVSMAYDVDSDLNVIQWVLSAYVLAWGTYCCIGRPDGRYLRKTPYFTLRRNHFCHCIPFHWYGTID